MKAGVRFLLATLSLVLVAACSSDGSGEQDRLGRDGLGNFAAKLESGEPVRVAYLGGSITEAKGWRSYTTAALKALSRGGIEEINAGLGGTGSLMGVYRLERDVVTRSPDLVFVEFSVNDQQAAPRLVKSAFEGIVRKLWRKDARTDVVFVHAYAREFARSLKAGQEPPTIEAAEAVAERYGIPSIRIDREVQQRLDDGRATLIRPWGGRAAPSQDRPALTLDGIHPTAGGHRVYADIVAASLERFLRRPPVDHAAKLAGARASDGDLERATWVPLDRVTRVGPWRRLAMEGNSGPIWEGSEPGSALEIRFRGASAELLAVFDSSEGGAIAVDVDGQQILKWAGQRGAKPHALRAYPKAVHLVHGLDPAALHRLRVSLVSPADVASALPRLRAAALLIEGEAVTENPGDAVPVAPSAARGGSSSTRS